MVEPDEVEEVEPLMKPRLVRFLKNRDKIIGGGMREEFWEAMEQSISARRAPDTVAERAVKESFNQTAEAAAPTVKSRVRDRLSTANEGILENL